MSKVVHGIVAVSTFPYKTAKNRNICDKYVPPFPQNRRTEITCKKCLAKLKRQESFILDRK